MDIALCHIVITHMDLDMSPCLHIIAHMDLDMAPCPHIIDTHLTYLSLYTPY